MELSNLQKQLKSPLIYLKNNFKGQLREKLKPPKNRNKDHNLEQMTTLCTLCYGVEDLGGVLDSAGV